MASFRNSSTRKGTIKLKTLRKPGVKDLSGMFDKAKNISDEKLGLADEAGLDGLLSLLDHEHPKIRSLAEDVIGSLISDDGEIIVTNNGFKACTELLRYKNTQAQRDTLWTIATLAGVSERNHEAILLDIGWNTILSRAKSQLPEIQIAAVTLIANLSLNEENHDMILHEDGLELLKQLANTGDIKLKRAVCNAFANLCSDEENVQEVLGDGGLELIISFLDSGDDELIAGALHTLANVASAEDVKQRIIDLGGLPPIIRLMESSNAMIQKGAVTAVANLVENQENHAPFHQAGGLDPLLFLARKSKNPEVQFRLASALNNLASNSSMKQILKDADAINPLKNLARVRDAEIKREAIEALAELGITYVSKVQVKKNQADEQDKLERERIERERLEAEARERQEREALERERMEAEAREQRRLESAKREVIQREFFER